MEPKFLSLTEVLEVHQDQLARYNGGSGIRDIELLKSALGMPSATYGGELLHTDVDEMAAAYLFHLVKNHIRQGIGVRWSSTAKASAIHRTTAEKKGRPRASWMVFRFSPAAVRGVSD